jgi:subtilisin family serine protease
MADPDDLFYYDEDRKVPLRAADDTLAIAYREGVPPKDLTALIQGDEELASFLAGPHLARRNVVLYKRRAGSRASLESFADRLRRGDAIAWVVAVFFLEGEPVVVTDEFIAAAKEGVSPESPAALDAAEGVETIEPLPAVVGPRARLLRVRRPGFHGALETANRYFETGLFDYAVPNFIRIARPDFPFVPNDPLFPKQWHLPRLKAPEAWDITRGVPAVVIAVMDSGVDLDHEDLKGQAVQGIDVFHVPSDKDPRPESALENHGTAVTGLVAARGNNQTGVSGVAPGCRFLPVRIFGGGPVGIDDLSVA